MSEARQLERSTRNHISAPEGERYKEQIDDCPVELELPTAVTPNAPQNNSSSTNKGHPPNSEHNPQGEQGPKPSTVRISTRATKGLPPTQWMLLASLPTISKAANEPYEPKSYQEATEDSMWKMWEKAMQEEFQSLLENATWSQVTPPQHRKILRDKWTFKLKSGA